MPEIKLTNVTKHWGRFYGVDHLNLDIENNAFITILGPSGCGKTTTLRMIAGLETPTSGQIKIGDQIVYDSDQGINVPPNKRKVGFLFQNYALWPNMTVYENISFGLKNVKEEKPVIDFDAKIANDMIRALKSGAKLKEVMEDVRDKNGKVDNERALIKLINVYTISMPTAKKLLSLGVHEEAEPNAAADSHRVKYEAEMEKIQQSHQAKGESLNERFELIKNGTPLREVRRLSKEEIDLAVRRVSRIVKIGMFMDRYPAELSGGQQQRVAIARTLAPEPQVLFMDEPLSNLDAKLRLEMRYELQRLHVETGSTFVYVTHDQMEAMTLSTKICLMNNGVLQQYAAPLMLYGAPNNLFCADFVGNPSINFIEGKGSQQGEGTIALSVLNGKKAVFTSRKPLNMDEWFAKRDEDTAAAKEAETELLKEKGSVEKENKDEVFEYHIAKVDEEDFTLKEKVAVTNEDFVLAIRPEKIKVTPQGKLDAHVNGSMPTGMESTLKLNVNGFLLTSVVFGSFAYVIGDEIHIDIDEDGILLYDRKSGKLIASGTVDLRD